MAGLHARRPSILKRSIARQAGRDHDRDHRALLHGDLPRDDAGDATIHGDGDLLGDGDRHLARGGLGDHPAGRHGDAFGPLLADVLAGGDRDGLDALLGDLWQVRTS